MGGYITPSVTVDKWSTITYSCVSCQGKPPSHTYVRGLTANFPASGMQGKASKYELSAFAKKLRLARVKLEEKLFRASILSKAVNRADVLAVLLPGVQDQVNKPAVGGPWWAKTNVCQLCPALGGNSLADAADVAYPVSPEIESRVGFKNMHLGTIPVRAVIRSEDLLLPRYFQNKYDYDSLGRNFGETRYDHVERNPYFQCHSAACVVPSKFMASAQVSYLLSPRR